MLKTYIFNSNDNIWIEEKFTLLKHDICAFLDEDQREIYIWKGPKSTKDKYHRAISAIKPLIEGRATFQLTLKDIDQKLPPYIQKKLDELIKTKSDDEERSKYLFSHFITIRFYFILLIINIVLPLVSVINLAAFFYWSPSGSNYMVMAEFYKYWLSFSSLMMIITILSFSASVLIGIFEQEYQVIVFSSIGLIICIGLLIYLQQGVFLFAFQEGSTELTYFINKTDLYLFFGLIAAVTVIFLLPNIIKLITFFKTYKKFLF